MITDPSLVELAKKLDALAPADWDARIAIAELMRPLLGDRYGEFDAEYAGLARMAGEASAPSAQKVLDEMGILPPAGWRYEGGWVYRDPTTGKAGPPQPIPAARVLGWLETVIEARDNGEPTDWHSALYSLAESMRAALASPKAP